MSRDLTFQRRARVQKQRLRFARLLAGTLVFLTGACNNKCTGSRNEPDVNPEIGTVTIVPSALSVLTGASFQLRVMLWDEDGGPLPDSRATNVVWTLDGLQGTPSGAAITIQATTPGNFSVSASVDGHHAEVPAQVSVVAPATTSGLDRIFASPSSTPVVAFVDGWVGSAFKNDTLISFVNEAVLDQFLPACPAGRTACHEVVLFGADREVGFVDHTARTELDGTVTVNALLKWSSNEDSVTFSGARRGQESAWEPLGTPISVPVTVWIAAAAAGSLQAAINNELGCQPEGDVVECVARKEFAVASEVFAAERTGIQLTLAGVKRAQTPSSILFELPAVAPEGWTCPSGEVRLTLDGVVQSAGGDPAVVFDKSALNVFYLEGIWTYRPDLGTSSPNNGLTCPPDGNGVVVLIPFEGGPNTSLQHEFGHALGLLRPDWGHANFVDAWDTTDDDDFDASNVMWSYESDAVTTPRSRITLGQAFRLGVSDSAWVNRANLRDGRKKACDDPFDLEATVAGDDPCPRITRDYRSP